MCVVYHKKKWFSVTFSPSHKSRSTKYKYYVRTAVSGSKKTESVASLCWSTKYYLRPPLYEYVKAGNPKKQSFKKKAAFPLVVLLKEKSERI